MANIINGFRNLVGAAEKAGFIPAVKSSAAAEARTFGQVLGAAEEAAAEQAQSPAGEAADWVVPTDLSMDEYRGMMPALYHDYYAAKNSGDLAGAELALGKQEAVLTAYYQSQGLTVGEAAAQAQIFSPFQYTIGGQDKTGTAIFSGPIDNLRVLGSVDPTTIEYVPQGDYFTGRIQFNDSMRPEQLETYGWDFASLAQQAAGEGADQALTERLEQLGQMQLAGEHISELQYAYDVLGQYHSVGNLDGSRLWANMGASTLDPGQVVLNAAAVLKLAGVPEAAREIAAQTAPVFTNPVRVDNRGQTASISSEEYAAASAAAGSQSSAYSDLEDLDSQTDSGIEFFG